VIDQMQTIVEVMAAIALIAVITVGLVWFLGYFIRRGWREIVGTSEKFDYYQKENAKNHVEILQFELVRERLLERIRELEAENDCIRKAWKPEEGIYCSCTFEDNHNPALINECGYHATIRTTLQAAVIIIKELREYSDTVSHNPDISSLLYYSKWVISKTDKFLESIKEIIEMAKEPSEMAEKICAECELCKVSSDVNDTIRERVITAPLCLKCANKDLIVMEDRHARFSKGTRKKVIEVDENDHRDIPIDPGAGPRNPAP
jgi:hypothetical protein